MKKKQPTAPTRTEPVQSPEQLQEKIRHRAYELYELRGRQDGRDFDDWLAAESDIAGSSHQ
ncbi:MAG: DUF2934 domain-containing protein [Acidobacteriia bacterium]|nr:DUF2934 domain-containing protein [Terriglobia bacterium]